MAKKWIITKEFDLIAGDVDMHKQLHSNASNIIGGGKFEYDSQNKIFWFWGNSTGFGRCSLEDVEKARKNVIRPSLDCKWMFSDRIMQHDPRTGGKHNEWIEIGKHENI